MLFITPILLFSSGCSSTENTVSNQNIQILNATYDNWSRSPIGSSDVPEVGTDLSVTVKNWSSDFTPQHIIFNNRKSLSATISDTLDNNIIITGRIIRTSSKLPKTSDSTEKSDRLVFSDSDGNTNHVLIEDWQRN
ncbi:hypothetical protein [Fodinibius sp. Rm-B-1B1-1]|uniref:hypothetical protein n=1 Tax=Fodinibius alkaliphilus TaxID=3140241 RepID=UPI00315AC6AA